jgi:crotonobetainyl-CoA:carnitine CoA-transferase CaiB-like acyl-CoA transferase
MYPLQGLKVLDFSHAADGPTCGLMLARAGADVIKIESLQGDPYRRGAASAAFLNANRNKRGLALNLQSREGKDIAYKLATTADIVIESFTPGVAERLGIGYAELSEINPRIIYCSLSGFGHSGPYSRRPAYDPVTQAMSGFMATTGEEGRPPVRVAPGVIGLGTAFIAGWGIALALIARERTGKGQHIDAAFYDTAVFFMSNLIGGYTLTGFSIPRMGSASPVFVPYQCFETADRYVFIAVTHDRFWQAFCAALGLDELYGDPRYATGEARLTHRDELVTRLAEILKKLGSTDILAKLEAADVPCAPVMQIHEVIADPQVQARGMLSPMEYPGAGPLKVGNLPFHASDMRQPPETRAPLLGEHTQEILKELGYDSAGIDAFEQNGVILRG